MCSCTGGVLQGGFKLAMLNNGMGRDCQAVLTRKGQVLLLQHLGLLVASFFCLWGLLEPTEPEKLPSEPGKRKEAYVKNSI